MRPADSGVPGALITADGLTITSGVGASLFDDRYRLSDRKPAKIKPKTVFPNDFPDPEWTHGDLLLQLCAHNPTRCTTPRRDIMRTVRGSVRLRWRIGGYNSPPRPSGTDRNLLGFKDGTANPSRPTPKTWLWVTDPVEPA